MFIKAARELGITVSELIGESSAPPAISELVEAAVAERLRQTPAADTGVIAELEARVGALTVEAVRWKQAGLQALEDKEEALRRLERTERMLQAAQARRRSKPE